jgi:hypothetical protein
MGAHWVRISQRQDVSTFAVLDTLIFAGSSTDGVLRSTDKGTTWQPVNYGLENTDVDAFAVTGTAILAGTDYGLFVSTDAGGHWSRAQEGLRWPHIVTFAVHGNSIFVGTGPYGVYVSANGGMNWSAVDEGLSGQSVMTLTLQDSSLYSGSLNHGVWRRPLSEMVTSVEPEAPEAPREFILEQNYPNPFNPSTDIRFRITDYGWVTLRVYDVLGREVATLVNERKAPGTYSVLWDAGRVSTGVYFYRLTSGGGVATRRMMVMR